MRSVLHKIFAIVAVSGIASCVSVKQYPGELPSNAPGGTVIGVGGTTQDVFVSTFSHRPIEKIVKITSVNGDGVNPAGSKNRVRLAAGHYWLGISCNFRNHDASRTLGTADLEVEIEAGQLYQLDAAPPCAPFLNNVLPK